MSGFTKSNVSLVVCRSLEVTPQLRIAIREARCQVENAGRVTCFSMHASSLRKSFIASTNVASWWLMLAVDPWEYAWNRLNHQRLNQTCRSVPKNTGSSEKHGSSRYTRIVFSKIIHGCDFCPFTIDPSAFDPPVPVYVVSALTKPNLYNPCKCCYKYIQ